MLQEFRDNLKGTAVFIVVLISIPFALVGIDQIFLGGSAGQSELSVNGEDITQFEVDRALAIHKQQLLSQYENLDPALLDDELLRKPVQLRLIRQKVMSQRAMEVGMGVGKAVFSDMLKNEDSFQINGRFDRDAYEFALRQMDHTQNSYYAALQDSMLISQTALGVAGTGIVTQKEVELTAELIEQKRDYYYLTVPIADLRKSVKIEEAQIEEYYQRHLSDFETEEQVIIDYLELSIDDLTASVIVEEEMIRELFDSELDDLLDLTRNRVEHILFANEDAAINEQRLGEVQSKLNEGALFGDLARNYSDDMGSANQGGDLGFIDAAAFPQGFSDTVASLDVGEVSAPLTTESGIHLIRLAEKESAEIPVYEQQRGRIQNLLERQLAEQLLPEKIDQLRELAYNAESLAEVASEMDLVMKTSKPFSRDGGEEIAAYPSVVSAAFGEEVAREGHASDVIELGTDRVAVVKLRELLPVKTLSLDTVRQEVIENLTVQKASLVVDKKGSDLLAQVQAGSNIEELAKQQGLPWQVSIDTRRFGGIVDGAIRDQAFTLPARSVLPRVTGFQSGSGDYIVLSLTRVTPGDLDKLAVAQRDNLLGSIRENLGRREFGSYQASLVSDADIEGLY